MRSVLSGPATSVAEILPLRQPYIWVGPEPRIPIRDLLAELVTSDIREINEPGKTLKWERGYYYLSGVLVLRPIKSDDREGNRRRFDVIVVSTRLHLGMMSGSYMVWSGPPTDNASDRPITQGARRNAQSPMNLMAEQFTSRGPEGEISRFIPLEAWPKTVTNLEARPGQVNEWTISLPEELIKVVRVCLKSR